MPQSPTTVSNIGVAMFAVADQDAAIAFYTETLGWELRADVAYAEGGTSRWVEVAPPGSVARVALNPPMGGQPGGAAIGVETPDMRAEYERVKDLDGVTIVMPPMEAENAPPMFALSDPDGNHLWVVETPPNS